MATFTEHTATYNANGEKKIYYLSAGPEDGPLLFFVHGWPAIAKTWKPQLNAFAAQGYRVVAPDMPGYGNSTSTKVTKDYSLEILEQGLLAVLKDVGREQAVFIGHDWGAGVVSSFAAHHPSACKGVVLISVPYGVIELGLEELLKYINRDIYPEAEYPLGQWEYQRYYELSFDEATAFFDKELPTAVKLIYGKGDPSQFGKPAATSKVVQDGGWFGGAKELPQAYRDFPLQLTVLDEELYAELVAELGKTGFWAADAYYMNHAVNREYTLTKSVNDRVLEFPVLFIESKFDGVCDTAVSKVAEPMRKLCKRLTEVTLETGHWTALEKPEETNSAIGKWLAAELPELSPSK